VIRQRPLSIILNGYIGATSPSSIGYILLAGSNTSIEF
jgi:hypothetical protein